MVAQVRPFMLQEDSKKKKLNNKNIHKEINQLRKDIERVSQEIDQLQTEKEDAISMGISYKKALNYYTTNFDFKIEMDEKVDENKYWVKLHFGDKLQFPVKFLFNQDTATVEDFDSLTLLSPDEEATLKNKYYKEQDICMVLKLLRNFALHKS
ncbi:uncharacterized protein LOC108738122 isoform X2 [Agrilus planipennis]|nr:uncharacterized protein LOC108738122 isoform X2 [Agrilus planipennis]